LACGWFLQSLAEAFRYAERMHAAVNFEGLGKDYVGVVIMHHLNNVLLLDGVINRSVGQ
jgi:hypothetical protein